MTDQKPKSGLRLHQCGKHASHGHQSSVGSHKRRASGFPDYGDRGNETESNDQQKLGTSKDELALAIPPSVDQLDCGDVQTHAHQNHNHYPYCRVYWYIPTFHDRGHCAEIHRSPYTTRIEVRRSRSDPKTGTTNLVANS
ncbi:hypothetical protein DOTSEDRAFT_39486 [Dothistroma septosporum NZE10]|uniref:Uncharacterized protein n=1 Tax=Dothistroma septosporum (strain NZE10 / CBS 128990) TaxID=675120 RepID=N1PBM8_DOTSN|nr:hypothetical protein DOTSEDRAFT_39486 [Dothistroma septosporum NZE10]